MYVVDNLTRKLPAPEQSSALQAVIRNNHNFVIPVIFQPLHFIQVIIFIHKYSFCTIHTICKAFIALKNQAIGSRCHSAYYFYCSLHILSPFLIRNYTFNIPVPTSERLIILPLFTKDIYYEHFGKFRIELGPCTFFDFRNSLLH